MVCAVLVAQVLLAAAAPVRASEESERLYSQGLVEFHAAHYEAALGLFNRAVATDPADAYAHYYRGVTAGRLHHYQEAVADLQAALKLRPDLQQAYLEIGAALVESGEYRTAIPWLQQARQRLPHAGAPAFYLGRAYLRLDELAAARQAFEQAALLSGRLAPAARYYEGVVAYRQQQWNAADAAFAFVEAQRPDTELGREAHAFRARIRQGARRNYRLFGSVGLQYDSNVVLAPSDAAAKDELAISRQADGRVTLNAGAQYVPWRRRRVELRLGYDFFQSLHFNLDQYNVQDQRGTAQLLIDGGRIRFGLLGRYDYYLLRADSFLQEATALPWIVLPEGDGVRTELFYRMRRRDFFKLPYNGIRDAFNHSTGVRQFFTLGAPSRWLALGYRFDQEDPIHNTPQAQQYAYDGNEVNVGFGSALPLNVHLELDYAYRHERYTADSLGEPSLPPGRREDNINQFAVAFDRPITEHVEVTAAYFGVLHDSNSPLYDYNRQIGSLSMTVAF